MTLGAITLALVTLSVIPYDEHMARWEPDAAGRLERATLELFLEQGFEGTTVADIAARAGVTKRTFFRHFADKREVLFWGQDRFCELISNGVTSAPPDATPIQAVACGLRELEVVFSGERRENVRQRRQVIAASPELQERESLKGTIVLKAVTAALTRRGVDDSTATVAAQLGLIAFARSYADWSESDRPFDQIVIDVLCELAEAATRVGSIQIGGCAANPSNHDA